MSLYQNFKYHVRAIISKHHVLRVCKQLLNQCIPFIPITHTETEQKHNVVPSLASPCATSCISENLAFQSQKNQFPLQGSMLARPPHLSTTPSGRFVHPVVVAAAG